MSGLECGIGTALCICDPSLSSPHSLDEGANKLVFRRSSPTRCGKSLRESDSCANSHGNEAKNVSFREHAKEAVSRE